jgi:hypothetical protein
MIRVPPRPSAPLPPVIIWPNEHRFQLPSPHPASRRPGPSAERGRARPGSFLSPLTVRPPWSAASEPQRVAAQAMQDTAPAEVHVIAAEEADPDDPPRRARWHPAHAKGPRRGHPLASAQRHNTSSLTAERPRPRLPVVISRVQRLPGRTPLSPEVLDDLARPTPIVGLTVIESSSYATWPSQEWRKTNELITEKAPSRIVGSIRHPAPQPG